MLPKGNGKGKYSSLSPTTTLATTKSNSSSSNIAPIFNQVAILGTNPILNDQDGISLFQIMDLSTIIPTIVDNFKALQRNFQNQEKTVVEVITNQKGKCIVVLKLPEQ